jgi:hypothetical protein
LPVALSITWYAFGAVDALAAAITTRLDAVGS